MPELPEILLYIHPLPAEDVRSAGLGAEGKTVRAIRRLGKRIVFDLDDDVHLVIHLMIAGRFQWKARGRLLADPAFSRLLREDWPRSLDE